MDTPSYDHLSGTSPKLFHSTRRYEILEWIGSGGSGEVYKVREDSFGREYALKAPRAYSGDNATANKRLVFEARTTDRLQHPGIPTVHDLCTEGEVPFFVMTLLSGRSLAQMLKVRQSPSEDLEQVLTYFRRICEIVGFAHLQGVVHRALKPSDILIEASGDVFVIDWGLAKLMTPGDDDERFGDGSPLGVLSYMPPEQARGEYSETTPRSDVFGLGAILCTILTGEPPFVSDDRSSLIAMVADADLAEAFARLDHCGLDAKFVAVCKRCLSPGSRDRFADANVLARAIGDSR